MNYEHYACCTHCRMLVPVDFAIASMSTKYNPSPCNMVRRANELNGKLGRIRVGEFEN